jgi:hypothetical protein
MAYTYSTSSAPRPQAVSARQGVRHAATLERIALLQQSAAQENGISWVEAVVGVKLTPAVQSLLQDKFVAFSSAPGNWAKQTVQPDPHTWRMRVTSRGYDVLSERVRAMIALGEMGR